MLLAFTVLLSGVVLGGVLVYGRFGVQRSGGNPVNDSRFVVDHVQLETDKPFEDVAKALERQLGTFNPDVRRVAAESGDTEDPQPPCSTRSWRRWWRRRWTKGPRLCP